MKMKLLREEDDIYGQPDEIWSVMVYQEHVLPIWRSKLQRDQNWRQQLKEIWIATISLL
jgi:hypothetical protein